MFIVMKQVLIHNSKFAFCFLRAMYHANLTILARWPAGVNFALIVSFIFYNYISSDESLESSVSTVYDARVSVIFGSFLYLNQSVKIEMLPIYFLMASFHLQYSDIQCPGYKVAHILPSVF